MLFKNKNFVIGCHGIDVYNCNVLNRIALIKNDEFRNILIHSNWAAEDYCSVEHFRSLDEHLFLFGRHSFMSTGNVVHGCLFCLVYAMIWHERNGLGCAQQSSISFFLPGWSITSKIVGGCKSITFSSIWLTFYQTLLCFEVRHFMNLNLNHLSGNRTAILKIFPD